MIGKTKLRRVLKSRNRLKDTVVNKGKLKIVLIIMRY